MHSKIHTSIQTQKKALGNIDNAGFRDHCKPLFKKYEIIRLPTLFKYQQLEGKHRAKTNLHANSI